METVLKESMAAQQRFEIAEASQIAFARRAIGELARGLGFNETVAGKLAIVVTECSTNLLKHAERGELLVRPLEDSGRYGIEVLCIDSGPGIADLYRCFEDGYTTAGSPGNGMGAIKRLSDELDIWSQPGQGTVLRTVFWSGEANHAAPARVTYGVVNLPLETETVSGDAWSCHMGENDFTVLVADGLGHGPLANLAAIEAAKILGTDGDASLERIMELANGALRTTRGAAVGIARVPFASDSAAVAFAGIGNISASVWSLDTHKHLVSHSGIVGHAARRAQQFATPYPAHALIVLHSDGLTSRWDLARYPGLNLRHPSLVAALLYRDFTRGRDDVTVFVARMGVRAP
ncbi:ATP-binding protein/SpoIIE family protein phosphatase [Caballeronia sp. LP006]|jgi:anti-sigma regulatory factor (Ser/Thr protein kinase)|uniref:ATP-binding SpoIIE family protein phosphatase n=1 Tax=unclassified Caballeronia TaxID=2646786 RepID=UPI002028F833|nr:MULTISPECIES: ATP-binding SpoIIE family protein phosphatase [unclassified Caballeronia]MDR5775108.1 ATP-binding protein/SpoIIE family protein phosphatase [Caballeronia sp. LZ002]MDR5801410.1 ATP-binding protein/SpoIIE family protein phosphatase [Caballeronia sp. LZ001]MDR5828254.1 ATP-binding protein/SpoIIE family protein phosphatase [Caballeronia sp. LP006]MDR5850546.1 ATP-binding protein/SpoIIE family protein phosphatase [Caballeronia sp. LZ003]